MSTRMNDSIRSAFVRAVLDDTPKEDYAEQRRKLIQDWLLSVAPAAVLKVYKDHDLRQYLPTRYVTYEGAGYSNGRYWLVPDSDNSSYYLKDEALTGKLKELDLSLIHI